MIEADHWRAAAKEVLRGTARLRGKAVASLLAEAGISRAAIEYKPGFGFSFETLAKLDAVGVCWKRIAFRAEELSRGSDQKVCASSGRASPLPVLRATAQG